MATREMTAREVLIGLLGRLQGLAGTVRHDLPDAFREEMRGVLDTLEQTIARLPH